MKELFAQLLKDEKGRNDLIEILRMLNQEGLEAWASEQLDQAIWEDPDLARETAYRLLASLSGSDQQDPPEVLDDVAHSPSAEMEAHVFAEAAAALNRALSEDEPRRNSLQLRYQRVSYLKLTQRDDPMGFLELKELHSQGPLARSIVKGLVRWESEQREGWQRPETLSGVRELLLEYGTSR